MKIIWNSQNGHQILTSTPIIYSSFGWLGCSLSIGMIDNSPVLTLNSSYMGSEGSAKKFTILFSRFKPNTVSSQLTLTDTFSGSEHFPSTARVIKQVIELLKISLLNRKRKPDASSRLAETGMSTDTRTTFALLSIFNARLSHSTRNLSFTNKPSPLSSLSTLMWSMNVQLLYKYNKCNLVSQNIYKKKKN